MSKNNRLTKEEKQKVFNLIAGRLVRQGRQSITRVQTPYGKSISCVYRKEMKTGPDLKCAIGQLIPKEAYRPEFDGYTGDGSEKAEGIGGIGYHITRIIVSLDRKKLSPLSRKAFSRSNQGFLRSLQHWHDGVGPEKGKAFLKELAKDAVELATQFRLELPPVLKAYLLWVLALLES